MRCCRIPIGTETNDNGVLRQAAIWATAKPQYSIAALAAAMVLPLLQPIASIILMMLALAKGLRVAMLYAAIASAVLLVFNAAAGVPFDVTAIIAVRAFVPVLVLAMIVGATRSITLTMQLMALCAVVGMVVLTVTVGSDPEYWAGGKEIVMQLFESQGLAQQIALFEANTSLLYRMLALATIFGYWISYTLSLLLGHYLFQQLPGNDGRYGRFRDLNFGRVIAITLVVLSVVSVFIDVEWIGNSAIVLFGVFTLQGIAVMHWLRAEGRIPMLALTGVYVLLVLSQGMLAVVLSVLGYLDALFDFRRRWTRASST